MTPLLSALHVVFGPVVLAVVAWYSPVWSRRDMFFSVVVDPAFAGSETGRRILAGYRRQVLLHAILASAVLVSAGLWIRRPSAVPLVLAVLLQVAGLFWSIARAHAQTRGHAAGIPMVREAVLTARREGLPGGPLAQAGPFLILAAAALVGRGTTEGLLPAAAACGVMLATSLLVLRTSRGPSGEGRARIFTLMLAIEYIVALPPAVLAVGRPLGLESIPAAVAAVAVAAVVATIALIAWVVTAMRREVSRIPGDGTANDCWRWGLFYYNADDPALFVPKRFGIGYTLNFARTGAWIFMLGTLLFVVLAMVLAPAA